MFCIPIGSQIIIIPTIYDNYYSIIVPLLLFSVSFFLFLGQFDKVYKATLVSNNSEKMTAALLYSMCL